MKKLFRQENIYSLIWCLYYMQGTFYAEGGIISQGLLALFLLLSIYYFVKVWSLPNLPKVINALQYLAILFGIYGLVRLGVSTSGWKSVNDATTYFKEYEISILPVFSYYYFSRNRIIDCRWFYRFSFIFFLTAIVNYYYHEVQAQLFFGRDEITNNSGYFVVSLLPLVVFFKRKVSIQYIALSIIFVYVVQGMKRGAIIAVIIGGAYFIWESYKKSSGSRKFFIVILGSIAVFSAILYFNYQLANSDYMQRRLMMTSDGDMSERENMYPAYYHYFLDNAGPLEYLFGYGADGTLKYMGDFAHQDWIETMMNQGLLGLVLLFNFWVLIIATAFKSRLHKCPNLTLIISMFIIIYLIKSMVSMSINGMTLFSTSALAYALAGLDDLYIREELND